MNTKTGRPNGPRQAEREVWGSTAQVVVSILVVLHLLAVFIPPFAFQASPVRGVGSPLADKAMDWARPYVDLMYLNHGYAFFAPNPGASHLLQAELRFADGRPPKTIKMPNLEQHWPRLLYHRYFMLSEHLNSAFAPNEPPPEVAENAEQLQSWRMVREMYERRTAAIESYLKQKYGADEVKLVRIEHRLMDPFEKFELRKRPDDPEMFLQLPETWVEEGPR